MRKKKLADKLKKIFSRNSIDDEFYEELEDTLVEGDIGGKLSMEITDYLRTLKVKTPSELRNELAQYLSGWLLSDQIYPDKNKLTIYLVLGVNGVGKTTSIAKFVHKLLDSFDSKDIVLSAGDTFRAAAIDQLQMHGEKLGVKVIHQQQGADPGAVIYDSIESAISRGSKIVIADTAGRLHNKANLIKELEKINKIIASKAPEADYKKILIIDATTGQNGLRQAEIFNEAIGVDSIILSKYDSAAKGGTILSINRELKIPVSYVGIGEKYSDFIPFDTRDYLNNLIGEDV